MSLPSLDTKIASKLKISTTPPLHRSPQPKRSQNKFTVVDPSLAFESIQKSDQQYQKVEIFKGFYDDRIPEIIVSPPKSKERKTPTDISPHETKSVSKNTSISLQCFGEVVLVSQYISGITKTYIKINYPQHRPRDCLFICGTGPGMSWKVEEALPLFYTGSNRWIYRTHEDFKIFEYRIVLNKKIFETYAHIINKDRPQKITPRFERR